MTNENAMYGAIIRGDTASVRKLVASDPSVLDRYAVKKSWLHWAAQRGHTEIMEVLVDAGLTIDQLTSDGSSTPLNIAAGLGRLKACEWLLDHGADINYGFGESATPIYSAIYSKSLELVELFVARGANLEATFGEPERDVIDYSETYGSPEIIHFLQKAKNRQAARTDNSHFNENAWKCGRAQEGTE